MKYHNVGEESQRLCLATVGASPDGKVFPVRCKRWACPVCAPINALHEAIKVANGVYALYAAGVRLYFATITQPPSVRTAEFAYRIIDKQWDGFRNRWQYWASKVDIPNFYAAFVEGQERRSGMPHFHIIGSALPDKETMRKWAVESGFGFMVDVQPMQPNAGAAWYVSKYSTKSTDAEAMPEGFRRVRYSRDWPRMLMGSELIESAGVVKAPRESYAMWAARASLVVDATAGELLADALALSDMACDVRKQESVAQALAIVQNWG